MLILALDTTSRGGSTAVVRDGTLLSLVAGDAARTHGERLPGDLSAALSAAGASTAALDLLVVATGPGPFTGLRIGLAAIQGLSMVTGVPVVGVSALDAMAAALWPDLPGDPRSRKLIVWLDAQRGEIFEGRYASDDPGRTGEPWRLVQDVTVAAPDAALAALDEGWRSAVFAGESADRARTSIAAWAGRPIDVPSPPSLAPSLAAVGALRARRGEAGLPHGLQPLYVRRPDAELDRLRRGSS